MHVNIGTLLPRHAIYRPEQTAVRFQTHHFTFRQLNGRVNRLVNALVPLSPMLRGSGLSRLLNDSDSVAVVTTTDFAPELNNVRGELPNCRYKAVPGNQMTMLFGDNVAVLAKEITTFLEES